MSKMKYIGKNGDFPFGEELDCTVSFPKGPKGPVIVEAEDTKLEYSNRTEMLGDWLEL